MEKELMLQIALLKALKGGSGGSISNPMTTSFDMGNNKITNLANAVNDGDAVNLALAMDLISTNTGYFRGSYASKSALITQAWQSSDPSAAYYVTNNDYAIVLDDETKSHECWRYAYVDGTGWASQYRINESPMTAAQIAAINSGITQGMVESLSQMVSATTIRRIWTGTQAQYDAVDPKDNNTLYFIEEE